MNYANLNKREVIVDGKLMKFTDVVDKYSSYIKPRFYSEMIEYGYAVIDFADHEVEVQLVGELLQPWEV